MLLQTKWNTSFPQQASSTSVMPNSEFKTHLEYKSNKPDTGLNEFTTRRHTHRATHTATHTQPHTHSHQQQPHTPNHRQQQPMTPLCNKERLLVLLLLLLLLLLFANEIRRASRREREEIL